MTRKWVFWVFSLSKINRNYVSDSELSQHPRNENGLRLKALLKAHLSQKNRKGAAELRPKTFWLLLVYPSQTLQKTAAPPPATAAKSAWGQDFHLHVSAVRCPSPTWGTAEEPRAGPGLPLVPSANKAGGHVRNSNRHPYSYRPGRYQWKAGGERKSHRCPAVGGAPSLSLSRGQAGNPD